MKSVFLSETEFGLRKILLLLSLLILPNFLALFHFSFFGLRIHFFQYFIFVSAFIFGPAGGVLSGGLGSLYTAIALNNPYIAVGNMILGGFAGFFMKKTGIIPAVLSAYLIQLPWLWLTDVYLAGMQIRYVNMIVLALLASNIICASFAELTAEKIKRMF